MKSEKEIINLIKNFERRHKKVYNSGDGDYFVECPIIENYMMRTASRKNWLGDNESWKKSKEEEKRRDKFIRCLTCEFIINLKQKLKENKKCKLT